MPRTIRHFQVKVYRADTNTELLTEEVTAATDKGAFKKARNLARRAGRMHNIQCMDEMTVEINQRETTAAYDASGAIFRTLRASAYDAEA